MDFEEAEQALTIKQWCARQNICPATFHAQQKAGTGPVVLKVPGSRVVRVIESPASWHRRMMALAATKAEQRARKRAIELRRVAVQSRWSGADKSQARRRPQ